MLLAIRSLFLTLLISFTANATVLPKTHRIVQINNTKVAVWKTSVYPNPKQQLTLHRHDHDRVVIALTNGTLKVTNNKNKSHLFILKQGQAYFLAKDTPKEMHTDTNIGTKPISVIVVELK